MREMVIQEPFYRQKRALLIFSAALIVIGLAEPNVDATIKLALLDAKLSSLIARWLIWIGGLYYAVGFFLEIKVTTRLNSTASVGSAGNFEDMSKKLADELTGHYSTLKEYAERVPKAYDGVPTELASAMLKLDDYIDPESVARNTLALAIPMAKGMTLREDELFVRAVEAAGKSADTRIHMIRNLQIAISDLSRKLDWAPLPEVLASLEVVKDRLSRAHRDMSRITNTVTIERRIAFWGWDVSAAFAAFAIATLIGLPLAETFGLAVERMQDVLAWTRGY